MVASWEPTGRTRHCVATMLALGACLMFAMPASGQPPSREQMVRDVQTKVVKIYGAGGIAGLEAYQSGCLISPEGHIATVWSYVLDVDPIIVLDDGRRFEGEVVGFEPRLELAVIKIDASGLPFFRVNEEIEVQAGEPVLAVSNLFSIAAGNEPASVMQGYVAGETNLEARRGSFRTAYDGPVYVLDLVANNPGAAGGALVDTRGRLLGMLGKELRDERTGVWLNYALPTRTLRGPISDIVAGRQTLAPPETEPLPADQAHSTNRLGIVMVPDVLDQTPAFVDSVRAGSAAAEAGLRPDDLILLVDGRRVDGQRTLTEILRSVDARDPISVTVQRGAEVVTVNLRLE